MFPASIERSVVHTWDNGYARIDLIRTNDELEYETIIDEKVVFEERVDFSGDIETDIKIAYLTQACFAFLQKDNSVLFLTALKDQTLDEQKITLLKHTNGPIWHTTFTPNGETAHCDFAKATGLVG
jgi:hypothetical protein